MTLRPRYSLLTLLILTALVAGGVKLWYGPHRAVERPDPLNEVEYQYTRLWWDERTLQGPRILRDFDSQGKLTRARVGYFRAGELVPWSICLLDPRYHSQFRFESVEADQGFSPAERHEHETAIAAEARKFTDQGTAEVGFTWCLKWDYD